VRLGVRARAEPPMRFFEVQGLSGTGGCQGL
jgi:hypothetical protein